MIYEDILLSKFNVFVKSNIAKGEQKHTRVACLLILIYILRANLNHGV